MKHLLQKINSFLYDEFVFSRKYRVWRHIFYWTFHITIWSVFWLAMGSPTSFARNMFNMSMWIPIFIFFGYPLAYIAVRRLLLKEKIWQFFLVVFLWGIAGLFMNAGYRNYLYIPLQEAIGLNFIPQSGLHAHSYLCMTTSAISPMIIRFFKLWTTKQRAWMHAKQEQMSAELQLLKAQVHPQLLFNTLNNIYFCSFERSPKTPGLILKLSSLLSYMLYDCKTGEVQLEKEIEMMKNYIDLEKERYGDKIDVSVNIVGDLCDKYISPLLILPFLENAFKHGTSEQHGRPWMSLDISLKDNLLKCKVVNSKNEFVPHHQNGVGIENVKKRLEFLYHDQYDLKLTDEGDFFVVSLMLELNPASPEVIRPVPSTEQFKMPTYESALPVD